MNCEKNILSKFHVIASLESTNDRNTRTWWFGNLMQHMQVHLIAHMCLLLSAFINTMIPQSSYIERRSSYILKDFTKCLGPGKFYFLIWQSQFEYWVMFKEHNTLLLAVLPQNQIRALVTQTLMWYPTWVVKYKGWEVLLDCQL